MPSSSRRRRAVTSRSRPSSAIASSLFNASDPAGSIASDRRKCSISWSRSKCCTVPDRSEHVFVCKSRGIGANVGAMTIEISLSGHVAVVVGGGGGGIGTAVCERLAAAGADLIAISVDPSDVADTVDRVTGAGRAVSGQVADVRDFDSLRAAIDAGRGDVGSPDLLVNVVGGVKPEYWHRLAEYPIETFDHLLTINLRYAFVSCQHVARGLIERGEPGAIVNISSVASRGQPLLAAYGAAKAGLDSLTATMAMEWGRHGIRVNTVAPGTVNTPRSGRDPDEVDPAAATIALQRRGRPDDIADVTLFLLSDLAGYVSGQTINVDGGPSRAGLDEHDLPVFVTNEAIRSRFDR